MESYSEILELMFGCLKLVEIRNRVEVGYLGSLFEIVWGMVGNIVVVVCESWNG